MATPTEKVKSCGIDDSNPSNKLPLYTTPNPFGIIKKIPKKLIPMVMKLFHLDRIAMDVILATITVPDEKIKHFMETKLLRLLNKVEKPVQEAMERLGQNVIEPIFRALPFVNIAYVFNDLNRAAETVDKVKGQGATALESVITDARDLYEDIQGPSRALSSLILGLGEYIQRIQDKLDSGEELTKEDINAMNIYKQIGQDYEGPPSGETTQRAAARLLGAELTKTLRENKELGVTNPDEQLIPFYNDLMLGNKRDIGVEQKELTDKPGSTLIDLLTEYADKHDEEPITSRKTRKITKSHRKKTSSSRQYRVKGSNRTKKNRHH